MKNTKLAFILSFIILVFCASHGSALQEATHSSINETIAQRTISDFSLRDYLTFNLGFKEGEKEILHGINTQGFIEEQPVFWWLGYGGEQEDRPGSITDYIFNRETRSLNHFHNPLLSWSLAGLNDNFLGQRTGQSSVLWAQNPEQHVGGRWSWPDARRYFYIALTGNNTDGTLVAPSKAERDQYFAYTFRAVGQIMHLVQDASVPEHVRNDIHIKPAYEAYVSKIREKNPSLWGSWLGSAISFDRFILDIPSAEPSAPVPISRIVDTDIYAGDNPGVTATITNSSQTIGIAEYTNANFLSKDTMFQSSAQHNFGYPRTLDTGTWTDSKNRTYIRKIGSGDTVDHLAVTSLLYFYRSRYFPQYDDHLPVSLDSECYKDYASKLIPRAVGYSAGLLNYFFRGVLEISAPDQYVYAITDGSRVYPYAYTDDQGNTYQTQQQLFSHIKAKVLNITPREKDPEGNVLSYEDIVSGSLIAVARYKVIPNYSPDLANYPPDGTVMMNEIEYRYSISQPLTMTPEQIISLNAEPMEFTFDFTGNEIPAGITDLTLQVVFKGTLGNETDVAVAVGMKNLMEPAHQVFWNLTDMFSLSDGEAYHLYTSEQIKNDSSLRTIVDLDHDGEINEPGEPYIDPHPMTYEVGYMGEPEPTEPPFTVATAMNLPAGSHVRLIVLVDDELSPNFLRLVWSDPIDSDTNTHDFEFFGVINEELNGLWQTPTQTEDFRHGLSEGIQIPIRQHFHTGILSCYPLVTDPVTGYKHCPYPEEEALPADLIPYPAGF
ncbi:MAG: hypothetical protein ACOYVJ_08095 [Nitrospirota bacterium]